MVVSACVVAIAKFGHGVLGRKVFHLEVKLVNQSRHLRAVG